MDDDQELGIFSDVHIPNAHRRKSTLTKRGFERNENEEDVYWEKKEEEHNRKRYAHWNNLNKGIDNAAVNADKSKETKIKILNLCLFICVMFTAVFNFYMSLEDSFRTIGERMRLEYLKKRGLHNCDALLFNLSWLNDIIHVLHAFFSVSLLHATTKETANICVFWIFSQAAETAIFLFITVYNLRFHDLPLFNEIAFATFSLIGMDIFGTIVILLRYYQLTNPYGERKRKLHTVVGNKKVLNFEIVFVHLPQFLQDKVSFREAANYETLVILQRLYGKNRTPTKAPPAFVAYEVSQGLADLKAVEHYGGVKKLRQLKIRQGHHSNSMDNLNADKTSCLPFFNKAVEPKQHPRNINRI